MRSIVSSDTYLNTLVWGLISVGVILLIVEFFKGDS